MTQKKNETEERVHEWGFKLKGPGYDIDFAMKCDEGELSRVGKKVLDEFERRNKEAYGHAEADEPEA